MTWSRRILLRTGALALFSLGGGPRFLDRLALAAPAAPSGRPRVLVSIFLRGAMDGLMAVPPLDEPDLQRYRPRLAMSAARSKASPVVDLDGRFGLHPAFAPLLPLWQEGRLAIVHAAGSPNPTRSHFDAQDYMETGTPWRKGTPSGWLNRLAAAAGSTGSPFGALSLSPELPRSLQGDEPALAIDDLSDFRIRLPEKKGVVEELGFDLEELYESDARGLIKSRGRDMFEALRALSQKQLEAYRRQRGSRYPQSKLGRSLLQIAYLVKAGVGLRIACAESAPWDTHAFQGTGGGAFARVASDLAASIAAFLGDLGPYRDDVVILTMTEFGRTVRENGSAGTDHGHGSCLFVIGNQVDGGRVYGDFPERLDPELLYEGRDLPVTTDFRAVFSEVAGKLFDVADDERIFPGWTGQRLPILW